MWLNCEFEYYFVLISLEPRGIFPYIVYCIWRHAGLHCSVRVLWPDCVTECWADVRHA